MSLAYYLYHKKILGIDPAPSTTDKIRLHGIKRPIVLKDIRYEDKTTISFTHNAAGTPDTINDSADGLITAGFTGGQIIAVRGNDTDNTGYYQVASAVAGVITLDVIEALVTENAAAAGSVTITTVSPLDEEFDDIIVSLTAYRLARRFGLPVSRTTEIYDAYLDDKSTLIESRTPQQSDSVKIPYNDL